MTTDLGIWIGALLTLFILSFLYKDNPFFRFAESLFAGVSLGYYIGVVADNTLVPNLFEPLFGVTAATGTDRWILLVPLAIGMLLYARFIPRIAWLARWSLAIYVGYYMGLQMMQKLQGEVQPQAADTILSLAHGVTDPGMWINNFVIVVGVLSVLVYFFFSAEHKGVTGAVSKVGIWFLMVSFGAAFGYTVMGRVSILIGRINWLLTQWLEIG